MGSLADVANAPPPDRALALHRTGRLHSFVVPAGVELELVVEVDTGTDIYSAGSHTVRRTR